MSGGLAGGKIAEYMRTVAAKKGKGARFKKAKRMESCKKGCERRSRG